MDSGVHACLHVNRHHQISFRYITLHTIQELCAL